VKASAVYISVHVYATIEVNNSWQLYTKSAAGDYTELLVNIHNSQEIAIAIV
jgi:hypothetical protein